MKKIVFLLIAIIAVLSSCSTEKPVVKKDRVHIYEGVDKFGEITPTPLPIAVWVNDYNNDGYITTQKVYDEYGELENTLYITFYGDNGMQVKEKSIDSDGVQTEVYQKDDGTWVECSYGIESRIKDIFTDEIDKDFRLIKEDYTDDHVNIFLGKFRQSNEKYKNDPERSYLYSDKDYIGKYTKYDNKGNWIEGVADMVEKETGSITRFYFKREVIEIYE